MKADKSIGNRQPATGARRFWIHLQVAAPMLCLVLTLAVALFSPNAAPARPEYALREAKACLYCHISASPGTFNTLTSRQEPTTRNSRGIYYAEHNHTFAGYVEKTVMGATAPPVFHFAWKEVLTDAPRRIGVGDLKGDGSIRFVTLNEKPTDKNSSTLTIKKWDGKQFVTEFTTDNPGPADKLQIGRFAGANHLPIMVTSGSFWYWNGKSYVSKALTPAINLFGATTLRDGSERVLVASSPTDVKAYRIDLNAQGSGILTDPIPAPSTNQVLWADMHATPEFFDKMGMPADLALGGLIGIWDVRKFGKTFLYQAKVNQDIDVTNDPNTPNKPRFILKSQTWNVAFIDTDSIAQNRPTQRSYFTPALAGEVYDIATASPKIASVPGLLILTSSSLDGKGRSLYFFPLD